MFDNFEGNVAFLHGVFLKKIYIYYFEWPFNIFWIAWLQGAMLIIFFKGHNSAI